MKKNSYYSLLKPPEIPILHNKSLILLPSLGMNLQKVRTAVGKISINSAEFLNLVRFRNSYLYWKECPENYTDELYLVFQPNSYSMSAHFPMFVSYLKSLSSFINIYSIGFRTFVVILAIDSKWKDVNPRKCVIEGKYSKLGSKFANTYYHPNEDIYKIIMREESKRKQLEVLIGQELEEWAELDSKPDLENENLKLEAIWDLEKE